MTAPIIFAESSTPAKKSGPIAELDGVRGIAILLVLLFHFQGPRPDSIPRILYTPLALGWSGVDLFFVLSGFLITGILIETRRSPNYFSSFYARRMLRIFPLYLVFVFLYFVISLPLARHFGQGAQPDTSPQIWYWLHLSNWQSAFGQDVQPLSHLWSLSIEEQFYFVWPMVVLLARPSWLIHICSMMIAVPLVFRLAFLNTVFGWELLHRFTPFRIDTLAVGCLIALIVRNEKWLAIVQTRLRVITFIAVSLLLAVLVFARSPNPASRPMITVGYTAFALTYGCLVFSAYLYAGSPMWLAALLRSAPLRALGKYSYAMYVVHWPIVPYQERFLSWGFSSLAPEHSRVVLSILSPALGILISFALSQASWHLLEKHFLRLKWRFVARPADTGPQAGNDWIGSALKWTTLFRNDPAESQLGRHVAISRGRANAANRDDSTLIQSSFGITTAKLPNAVVKLSYVGATLQAQGSAPPRSWSSTPGNCDRNVSSGVVSERQLSQASTPSP